MYSNNVLNVFNNPKNTGRISKPDGIASCYNYDATAHIEFSFRIESGIITECKFRAQANPYIIAICSTITTMLKGKMVAIVFLDPYSIKKELGDESDYDIGFCIDCVKMAIDDYKEKLTKENKESKKTEKDLLENKEQNDLEIVEDLKDDNISVNSDDDNILYDDDFGDDFLLNDLFEEEE